MKQEFVKLKVAKKSENGFIFKQDSIMQVVGGKLGGNVDLYPILAYDEHNLPYHAINDVSFYSMALKEGEYEVTSEPSSIPKYALNYPGSYLDDEKFDTVQSILDETYADRDYTISKDGDIKKKAEKEEKKEDKKELDDKKAYENHQTPTNDKITTKLPGDGVAGQNDPGYKDNYKEEVSEHPAGKPILGPLTGKIAETFKILNAETKPNFLSKPGNISMDFSTEIGGAGTVKKNTYSEEVSEHKTPKPLLGPLAKKIRALQKKAKVRIEFNDDDLANEFMNSADGTIEGLECKASGDIVVCEGLPLNEIESLCYDTFDFSKHDVIEITEE